MAVRRHLQFVTILFSSGEILCLILSFSFVLFYVVKVARQNRRRKMRTTITTKISRTYTTVSGWTFRNLNRLLLIAFFLATLVTATEEAKNTLHPIETGDNVDSSRHIRRRLSNQKVRYDCHANPKARHTYIPSFSLISRCRFSSGCETGNKDHQRARRTNQSIPILFSHVWTSHVWYVICKTHSSAPWNLFITFGVSRPGRLPGVVKLHHP
jgi:hypothetical protein